MSLNCVVNHSLQILLVTATLQNFVANVQHHSQNKELVGHNVTAVIECLAALLELINLLSGW